jgi:hypothetical protein
VRKDIQSLCPPLLYMSKYLLVQIKHGRAAIFLFDTSHFNFFLN